ncbi:hypothetical protein Lalb_Chr00c01g0403881 [Lupinus albus]|uniref:Uncharacterized protein n=1 Tax=Lupinus albus TaxID=3870 RepID=A0A6A4MSW7_LUPAL|nr:hypothetical protein Lalb_Chr00c01g0403881 [Lupinus albus]
MSGSFLFPLYFYPPPAPLIDAKKLTKWSFRILIADSIPTKFFLSYLTNCDWVLAMI